MKLFLPFLYPYVCSSKLRIAFTREKMNGRRHIRVSFRTLSKTSAIWLVPSTLLGVKEHTIPLRKVGPDWNILPRFYNSISPIQFSSCCRIKMGTQWRKGFKFSWIISFDQAKAANIIWESLFEMIEKRMPHKNFDYIIWSLILI